MSKFVITLTRPKVQIPFTDEVQTFPTAEEEQSVTSYLKEKYYDTGLVTISSVYTPDGLTKVITIEYATDSARIAYESDEKVQLSRLHRRFYAKNNGIQFLLAYQP